MFLDVIIIVCSVELDKILFFLFMINLYMKDEYSDEEVLNLKVFIDKNYYDFMWKIFCIKF